jgi:hypothetical protein
MNILYRIFSYVLIVIAAFFGIASLFALLMALVNPALLLSVFVIIAVVIYSIASFVFLQKGINSNQPLQPRLKDWIKVNAYVAIVFVGMNIFQSVAVINNPNLLQEAMKQATGMQAFASPLSETLVLKMIKAIIWFMLIYSVILGIHILQTFRYLKEYAHLFAEKTNSHPTGDSF